MTKLSREKIFEILNEAKVIAVVGHSDKPYRTSYAIANYLQRVGYKVYPVNPLLEEIEGEKVYPTVSSIPEKVDIVNIFRRSEHLDGIADDAIQAGAKVFWSQLGVFDKEAGEKAEEAGLDVIMNRCIEVVHKSYNFA